MLQDGRSLGVLGTPRVSLAGVWSSRQNANKDRNELGANLPYEMIIVGDYPLGLKREKRQRQ